MQRIQSMAASLSSNLFSVFERFTSSPLLCFAGSNVHVLLVSVLLGTMIWSLRKGSKRDQNLITIYSISTLYIKNNATSLKKRPSNRSLAFPITTVSYYTGWKIVENVLSDSDDWDVATVTPGFLRHLTIKSFLSLQVHRAEGYLLMMCSFCARMKQQGIPKPNNALQDLAICSTPTPFVLFRNSSGPLQNKVVWKSAGEVWFFMKLLTIQMKIGSLVLPVVRYQTICTVEVRSIFHTEVS